MKDIKTIEIDFLQIGKGILRLWHYIVLAVVLAGVIGLLYGSFYVTPVYSAGAKMIVNSRVTNTGTGQITSDQLASSMKLTDTCAIIIRSRKVLQPIITELNLPDSYENLAACVEVTSVNETPIMEVTVFHPDLETAKAVTSKILEIAPGVIKDTIEAGSVKTVDETYFTEAPVSRGSGYYAVFFAIAGLVAGCAGVVVITLRDNTVKTVTDIQNALGITVLGCIPSIETCEVRGVSGSTYNVRRRG